MTTYLIILIATNAAVTDFNVVTAGMNATFKTEQVIDYTKQPIVSKAGVDYYMVVANNNHLVRTRGGNPTDLNMSANAWNAAKARGVVILDGNDWAQACSDAGYTATAAEKAEEPK